MDNEFRKKTISKSIPFFLGVISLVALLYKNKSQSIAVSLIIIGLLFIIVSIYIIIYLLSPIEYLLTDEKLIIRRPIGKVIINLKEISSVNIMNNIDFLNNVRTTIRKSGIFGVTGTMMLKNAKTNLYITRTKENVLIKLFNNENIIISVNDLILVVDLGEAMSSILLKTD